MCEAVLCRRASSQLSQQYYGAVGLPGRFFFKNFALQVFFGKQDWHFRAVSEDLYKILEKGDDLEKLKSVIKMKCNNEIPTDKVAKVAVINAARRGRTRCCIW